MAEIAVPEGGLALIDPLQSLTGEDASMNQGKPCQFIRLDLPKAALGEILRNARHGGKGVNVSFGKTIVSGLLNPS